MFIDDDLTIEEQLDYYIYKYSSLTDNDDKVMLLEVIKQLNSFKDDNNEL